MSKEIEMPEGIKICGEINSDYARVLTPEALSFVASLHRKFDATRLHLLEQRAEKQKRYDEGALPNFLESTENIRTSDWRVGAIPGPLQHRAVEITGPVDRKMIVNALNSGANVFMADFEDASSPLWSNMLDGQVNLKDLWNGDIAFRDPRNNKHYEVGPNPAVLIVRPRGWHLVEAHMVVDGAPVSGSLFDFGLYVFHNARKTIEQGRGPYFYLPKIESHEEARLWNDVFINAQNQLELELGTIKATVLIETLPAAFEMDEILFELKDHIVGLNIGRWDYIFSFIKTLSSNPDYILPDRAQLVMGKAFLGAYARLLIKTCHRRSAYAMGGMAAQIPVKGDERANEEAFAKVKADKEREARDGNDGTWVAHPGLVPVAKEVFDRLMPKGNQLDRTRDDVQVSQADLLEIHQGQKTEAGMRENIRVGIQYIEAWLQGRGAVPLYNLMEDAATAEISRAQIWQWLKFEAELNDGRKVTPELFDHLLKDEMAQLRQTLGEDVFDTGRFADAIALFGEMSLAKTFIPFLTLPAYELIK